MSKISGLPEATELDGNETVVMVKAGTTRRGALAGLVGAAVAPHVQAAEVAAAVATAEVTIYASIAAGEAATVADETFFVDNGDQTAALYRRTAGGSEKIYDLLTKGLIGGDEGAELIGMAGGGTTQDAIAAMYPTTQALFARSWPAPISLIETSGYATRGDGGGGTWVKVADDPGHGAAGQDTSGQWWELAGDSFTLQQLGSVPDARLFNPAKGQWEDQALEDITDNAAACVVAGELMMRGRKLLFRGWHGVDPANCGHGWMNLTDCKPVRDGCVVPMRDYVVHSPAGTGTLTYDGTVYTSGQTFRGVPWADSYTVTGEASLYDRILPAILADFRDIAVSPDQYGRDVQIDTDGTGGLVLLGEGVGVAVLGSHPKNARIFNCRVNMNGRTLTSLGEINTMAGLFSATTFRGKFDLTADIVATGYKLSECWNSVVSLDYTGGGIGRLGIEIDNANDMNIQHIFTHNTRRSGYVRFANAHGASVGDSVVMTFNGQDEYTGTVTHVNNSHQVYFSQFIRTGTASALDYWTARINGGAAVPLVDGRSNWGKGYLISDIEGTRIFHSTQNNGGFAGDIVLHDDAGNSMITLDGHIEGPSNAIRIRRAGSASTEYMQSLQTSLSFFTQRAASQSSFGVGHGLELDYVRSANIGSGRPHGMEYIHLAAHGGEWTAGEVIGAGDVAAGCVRVLPWGVYQYVTAGACDAANPPTSLVKDAVVTDGTAECKWVRYPGKSILIKPSCENVTMMPQTVDNNTYLAFPLDLQDPDKKSVGTGGRTIWDSVQAPEIINASGAGSITATTGDIRYRHSPILAGKTEEKRWPGLYRLRVRFTPAALGGGADARFAMVFSTDTMNVLNDIHVIVTAAELANALFVDRIVDVPLSPWGDFLYRFEAWGSGGWDMAVRVRLMAIEF